MDNKFVIEVYKNGVRLVAWISDNKVDTNNIVESIKLDANADVDPNTIILYREMSIKQTLAQRSPLISVKTTAHIQDSSGGWKTKLCQNLLPENLQDKVAEGM